MSFKFVVLEGHYQGKIIKIPEERMLFVKQFIEIGKIKPCTPSVVDNFYRFL